MCIISALVSVAVHVAGFNRSYAEKAPFSVSVSVLSLSCLLWWNRKVEIYEVVLGR